MDDNLHIEIVQKCLGILAVRISESKDGLITDSYERNCGKTEGNFTQKVNKNDDSRVL